MLCPPPEVDGKEWCATRRDGTSCRSESVVDTLFPEVSLQEGGVTPSANTRFLLI